MATQPAEPPGEIPPGPRGEKYLTLFEHLNELRRRLTISALVLVLTTVVALVFTREIIEYITGPARNVDPDFKPIFTELLGFVGAYVKVGLLVGVAAGMPVFLYQMFAFVNPALTGQERKWIVPITLLASLSFAGGGAFAYFIAWPPALDFLLDFGTDLAEPQIRINNYVDMLTRFVFWSGMVFETPLVLMGLGYLGLVTARRLVRMWRVAVIGSFVIAALITPSIDPITQTAVAVPLMVLYGLGIALVKLVQDRGPGAAR